MKILIIYYMNLMVLGRVTISKKINRNILSTNCRKYLLNLRQQILNLFFFSSHDAVHICNKIMEINLEEIKKEYRCFLTNLFYH